MRFTVLITALLATSLTVISPAAAEITKMAHLTGTGFAFNTWPRLPAVAGWSQDDRASQQNNAYVIVPDGQTFRDAPAVIYGNAIYKPSQPSDSLDAFIADDKAEFVKHDSGLVVKELAPVTDASRRKLRVFIFQPSSAGNWEAVAYGEERDNDNNDYWLLLVVSGRDKASFEAALPLYLKMLSEYR